MTPDEAATHGLNITRDGVRRSALDLIGDHRIDPDALAVSLEEFEHYFESGQAQLWERQSLCKARPIYGSEAACQRTIHERGHPMGRFPRQEIDDLGAVVPLIRSAEGLVDGRPARAAVAGIAHGCPLERPEECCRGLFGYPWAVVPNLEADSSWIEGSRAIRTKFSAALAQEISRLIDTR